MWVLTLGRVGYGLGLVRCESHVFPPEPIERIASPVDVFTIPQGSASRDLTSTCRLVGRSYRSPLATTSHEHDS